MHKNSYDKLGFKYKTSVGLKPNNFFADGMSNGVMHKGQLEYMRVGDVYTAPHSHTLQSGMYTKVNITLYPNADGEHWFEINYNDNALQDGLKIGPLPTPPQVLLTDTHLYAAAPGHRTVNVNLKDISFKTSNCPVGQVYSEDDNGDGSCQGPPVVPEGQLYKSLADSIIMPSADNLLTPIPKLFNRFELIFYAEQNEFCDNNNDCSIFNFGGGGENYVSYGEVFMHKNSYDKLGFKYKTSVGLKPNNFFADGMSNGVMHKGQLEYMRVGDVYTAPHSHTLQSGMYTKVNITLYPNADGEHWFEINYNDNALQDGLKIGPLPTPPQVLLTDTHLYAAAPGHRTVNVNLKDISFKTSNCPVGQVYSEDDNGDGSCQDPNASKCKNEECWEWDKDASTCTMKAACMKVTCNADSMDVEVKSALFGLKTADTAKVTPEPEGIADPADGFNFKKTCNLGECDMTYKIVDTNLVFTMMLKEAEQDGFLDTIDNSTDAITLNSNPLAIGVKFTCSYPVAVEISSGAFDLKDVVLGAGPSGVGSLANGFSLGLDSGIEAPIKLGDRQTVTASWAVTSLKKVYFNFTDCTVDQGGTVVALVKNKCYSEALKVSREDGTATAQSFSYTTFSAVGATTTTQTMKCGLNICMDDCDLPETDDDCLKTGEDAFSSYKFKVAGYEEPSVDTNPSGP